MKTVRETFKTPEGISVEVIHAIGYAHWASYLINGDRSGLDYYDTPDDPNAGDREVAAADAFQKWLGGCVVDAEGEPFYDRPDRAGGASLPFGECVVYTAIVYSKEGCAPEGKA